MKYIYIVGNNYSIDQIIVPITNSFTFIFFKTKDTKTFYISCRTLYNQNGYSYILFVPKGLKLRDQKYEYVVIQKQMNPKYKYTYAIFYVYRVIHLQIEFAIH